MTREEFAALLPQLPYDYVWELAPGMLYNYHLILHKKIGWLKGKRQEVARKVGDDLAKLLVTAPKMIEALQQKELFGEYTNEDIDPCLDWDF